MLIRRIARPMLATTFIARGVDALRSPKSAADATRPTLESLSKLPEPVGARVPSDAETVARATGAVQIGAGLLLATGRLPRFASAALALSMVPGSLGGHAFWNEVDAERRNAERRAFLADISLVGGLVIASVDTEGRPSLGWRGRRAARKVSANISNVMPSSGSDALIDSELVDRVGHGLQTGLHVGAERGRELAHVARERGAELADVAQKRGAVLADVASKRSAELTDIARERAPVLAEVARERGAELAEVARERGPVLAERARKRGSELAEIAQDRSSNITDSARKQIEKQRRSR